MDYSGLNVDQVWDCTGVFLTRKALQPYFDKGVPKVVVSEPVKDAEPPVLNIVYGGNHVSKISELPGLYEGWRAHGMLPQRAGITPVLTDVSLCVCCGKRAGVAEHTPDGKVC